MPGISCGTEAARIRSPSVTIINALPGWRLRALSVRRRSVNRKWTLSREFASVHSAARSCVSILAFCVSRVKSKDLATKRSFPVTTFNNSSQDLQFFWSNSHFWKKKTEVFSLRNLSVESLCDLVWSLQKAFQKTFNRELCVASVRFQKKKLCQPNWILEVISPNQAMVPGVLCGHQ